MIDYWDLKNNEGRKSIPLEELEKNGYELYYGLSPRIPFLDVVDVLIEKAFQRSRTIMTSDNEEMSRVANKKPKKVEK